MKVFLLTAPARARWRAPSIDVSVEVPDVVALDYLVRGIARADRSQGEPERAVVAPEEQATATPPAVETEREEGGEEEAGEPLYDDQGRLLPWTMQVSPEQYLKQWASGKHAALAAAHAEAKKGGEGTATKE